MKRKIMLDETNSLMENEPKIRFNIIREKATNLVGFSTVTDVDVILTRVGSSVHSVQSNSPLPSLSTDVILSMDKKNDTKLIFLSALKITLSSRFTRSGLNAGCITLGESCCTTRVRGTLGNGGTIAHQPGE